MITLGIDISSQPKDTAVCRIEWRRDRIVVSEPVLRCTDEVLDELIRDCDNIGVDAPFGWPTSFANAVKSWHNTRWTTTIRDDLRFRVTDRAVNRETDLRPLSVSTDRIVLPAMRTMAMLLRHGVTNRAGDGHFFKVYPAASLCRWGMLAVNDTCIRLAPSGLGILV